LPIGNIYQTINGTDLQASDFGLYDFSTGIFNQPGDQPKFLGYWGSNILWSE